MTRSSLMSENLTASRTDRGLKAPIYRGSTRSVVANNSQGAQGSTSRALRGWGEKRLPFDVARWVGHTSISTERRPEIEQTRNVGIRGSASARCAGGHINGTERSHAWCRTARSVVVPKKREARKGVFVSFANNLSWSQDGGAEDGSENQSGGDLCRSAS
jgi:hypothetical protein